MSIGEYCNRETIIIEKPRKVHSIRRADVLRKMLAERFTWPGACKQLLAELVRVE